jgi:hypothetical protein
VTDRARIIVTGARLWIDRRTVREALFAVAREAGGLHHILLVHGDCPATDRNTPGADQLAAHWAADNHSYGVRAEPHPADWDHCTPDCPPRHRVRKRPGDTVHPGLLDDFCPGAGPRRNAEMVDLGAEKMLAFPLPSSRGTWNAIRLAKAAGIPVRQYPVGAR